MKRIQGYIRWFDAVGDDGILVDFEGNEYYFNSWSFSKTKYRVTGTCKRTGRIKTITTRHYPGLFLNYKVIQDPICNEIQYKHNVPVTFEQADGVGQRWAVKIKLAPELTEAVYSIRLLNALSSLDSLNASERQIDRDIWMPYTNKALGRLIDEAINYGGA